MLTKLSRYFHTLKYLKLKQIYFRLFYFFYKPTVSVNVKKNCIRKFSSPPINFILKEKNYLKNNIASFLNHRVDISNNKIWNDTKQEKLWLYNLHYFDALNTDNSDERKEACALLERWIDENPPFIGAGWEPFPISLRIVNIIKYALSGNFLSEKIISSLYIQARFLNKKCEYHLLGNHLFENFKSLCIAGLFFDTNESEKWFQKGCRGLKKEISEQILVDGGHFELSPLYHSIILEGLLDLHTIFNTYKKEFIWKKEIEKMLLWLQAMTRSDYEIAYFNDAGNGIAEKPVTLFSYAQRLGYALPEKQNGLHHFSDSGYIVVRNNHFKMITDVGNIGPDYLPGHGHADVLSFELMIDDVPVFVNLGTSCYGHSDRRLFERGTSAHNTVVVDNQNSSDVWSGFRVGKRARIIKINIVQKENDFFIDATHNGYARLKNGLFHERKWIISENKIEIMDKLNKSVDNAHAYFHLHPDCTIISHVDKKIMIQLRNKGQVEFEASSELTIVEHKYAQGFGKLQSTQSINIKLNKDSCNSYVNIITS